jgi:hypothetical protein
MPLSRFLENVPAEVAGRGAKEAGQVGVISPHRWYVRSIRAAGAPAGMSTSSVEIERVAGVDAALVSVIRFATIVKLRSRPPEL